MTGFCRLFCATACAVVFLMGLTYSLHADTILDANSFASSQPMGGGFVVATSNFNLSSGQIADVLFEADFTLIDAGIEIVVNNTVFFSTGDDVSNFGQQVFNPTADQPNNIDFSFSPNQNGLPRLTVSAAAAGTSFSGAAFVNSTAVVDYDPWKISTAYYSLEPTQLKS